MSGIIVQSRSCSITGAPGETACSMLQVKPDASVRSKSGTGQVNEMWCRVLRHHGMLLQAVHESGIESRLQRAERISYGIESRRWPWQCVCLTIVVSTGRAHVERAGMTGCSARASGGLFLAGREERSELVSLIVYKSFDAEGCLALPPALSLSGVGIVTSPTVPPPTSPLGEAIATSARRGPP
jgi:hypothetical protein